MARPRSDDKRNSASLSQGVRRARTRRSHRGATHLGLLHQTLAEDAIDQHILHEIPLDFVSAQHGDLGQTTMRFMASDPASADRYRTLGFDMFWRGIAKNSS